jgi:hypothetical protein
MFCMDITELALFVLFWKYRAEIHPDYVYCSTKEIQDIATLLYSNCDTLLTHHRDAFNSATERERYLKIEGESEEYSGDPNSCEKIVFVVKNMSKKAKESLEWRTEIGIWKQPGIKEAIESFLLETTKNAPRKKPDDIVDVPMVLQDLFSGKTVPTKHGDLKVVGNEIFLGKKCYSLEDAIVIGGISNLLKYAIGYE